MAKLIDASKDLTNTPREVITLRAIIESYRAFAMFTIVRRASIYIYLVGREACIQGGRYTITDKFSLSITFKENKKQLLANC